MFAVAQDFSRLLDDKESKLLQGSAMGAITGEEYTKAKIPKKSRLDGTLGFPEHTLSAVRENISFSGV